MKIEFDNSLINQGIIKCIINEKYVGIAKCHPDDMDMFSKKTGESIAFDKAYIKLRKAALTKKKEEIAAIENFIRFLDKKVHPYWIDKYRNILEYQKNKLEAKYEDAKAQAKDYILAKEFFYKSVRKNRTQQEN